MASLISELLARLRRLLEGRTISESYAEVVDMLTNLRDTRTVVAVNFDGEPKFYPSRVTAVNARHHVMTISNSMPLAPAALQKDRSVTIKAQRQGRELVFHSRFLEPLLPDHSFGYQVTIPAEMVADQPRHAFRVMLDEFRERAKVTLRGPDDQCIEGVVNDISREGVGLRTHADLPRFLTRYFMGEDQKVKCDIELDSHTRISCELEIRNVHNKPGTDHATFIGGRMSGLDASATRTLVGFVSRLQQQHLRAYA